MKLPQPPLKVRRNAGFTLLEMVIVLGIIAMIMGGAIFAMRGIAGQAKPTQAKTDINSYLTTLNMYRINTGQYPSTQQGLQALVGKGMSKLTLDPWSREYVYRFPGKKNPNEPEIICLGDDGQEGTADDINSQDF